jgi:error-prone DNA polymerase
MDVQVSEWASTIEHESDSSLSLRLGLGYAKGLRKQSAEAIAYSRAKEGGLLSLTKACEPQNNSELSGSRRSKPWI